MPLVIRRSPLPVKERDASAQEEADRHYSLGYREGLLGGLKWAKDRPWWSVGAARVDLRTTLAHVQATGRLPGEEAKGG